MKITYLSHSGFAVELPSATLLFDYYKGHIPAFPADKPLYVFSSHSHGDHFVPQIFDLSAQYPHVQFVLSHDIWMMRKKHTRAGIPEEAFAQADYLRAYETKSYPHLSVTTLRSTDMGVAFVVTCDGKKIYHAGDLHWWAWPGDTKANLNNMTANYQREIHKLQELLTIHDDTLHDNVSSDSALSTNQPSPSPSFLDVAFLPLDGRLEENYAMGINYFLEHIPVNHVFPMHFWDQYQVITDYLNSLEKKIVPASTLTNDHPHQIYHISEEGQHWFI